MSEASALSSALGLQYDEKRKAHIKVVTITRLNAEVYRKFEESLPKAVIDKNASDAGCDASFKLGIQYILQRMRNDLVVE